MELHIGEEIRKALAENGMSKAEFARRMNMSSQNVYKIFHRPHIDTEVLLRASHVLKNDFFAFFSNTLSFQPYIHQPLSEVMEPPASEYLQNIIKAKEEYIQKLESLMRKSGKP